MLIIPVLIMPSQASEHSSGPCPAPGAAKLDPLHGKTPGNGRFCYEKPPSHRGWVRLPDVGDALSTPTSGQSTQLRSEDVG